MPWLCHDITPVQSILNQSLRACISPRPLQGPVPGIHPEDVDDSLNTGTTSTTQPYSATASKVVAKLSRKVILMLEKAAILKNGSHLGHSVSQNKN